MATNETRPAALRRLLDGASPVVAPGVYDALTARLVERSGFPAMLVSGAGVSASVLGRPDLGFLTMSESLSQTRNIVSATDLPVIADCDTGYGSPVTVTRTIAEYEAAGVAGLFIEDQVEPKRCGHFDGKSVVGISAMVQKLRAAVDTRRDPDLVLIARTDARATEGLQEAIARMHAYADAGADMVFVEAPQSEAELEEIGRAAPVPLMCNLVEGGRTPLLPASRLGELNFKLITYSGTLQKVAIHAMQRALDHMAESDDVKGLFPEHMVSLAERSAILGLDHFQQLEDRYRG